MHWLIHIAFERIEYISFDGYIVFECKRSNKPNEAIFDSPKNDEKKEQGKIDKLQ